MSDTKLHPVHIGTPNTDLAGYLMPLHWENSTDGILFPLPYSWRLQTIENLLGHLNITKPIINILPLIWQIEPILYKVARHLEVPIHAVPYQNTDLLDIVFEKVGVDVIITTPLMLEVIRSKIENKSIKPKIIILIHTEPTVLTPHFEDVLVAHELHILPGFAVAFQDYSIVKGNEPNLFRIHDLCTVTNINGVSYVTTTSESPVHFKDIPSSFHIIHTKYKERYLLDN